MKDGRREAKRSLGQNFLVSGGVVEGIVAAVTAEPRLPVFEIGPGKGAITIPIALGGTQIAAFEIDEELARETAVRLEGADNAEIVLADYRRIDLDEEAGKRGWGRYVLVGNIPYLLTSKVMLGLPSLELCARAVIMLQKEVAERILAAPGSRRCGILSVYLQSYLRVEKVITAGPGSFRPRPKVDSVVLLLSPEPREGAPRQREEFLSFLKGAFSQRRKKLSNVLKGMKHLPPPDEIERTSGVDTGRRPEELPLDDWFALFDACTRGPGG
jgi:16S rRNA (adenine1518-N6/adenine1519-N6)-dimethyltransferase